MTTVTMKGYKKCSNFTQIVWTDYCLCLSKRSFLLNCQNVDNRQDWMGWTIGWTGSLLLSVPSSQNPNWTILLFCPHHQPTSCQSQCQAGGWIEPKSVAAMCEQIKLPALEICNWTKLPKLGSVRGGSKFTNIEWTFHIPTEGKTFILHIWKSWK